MNLKDFGNYQIDGQYHMKMVWSLGESVEWKQGLVYKIKIKTIIFFLRIYFYETVSQLKIFSKTTNKQPSQKWLELITRVTLIWFFMDFHSRVSNHQVDGHIVRTVLLPERCQRSLFKLPRPLSERYIIFLMAVLAKRNKQQHGIH